MLGAAPVEPANQNAAMFQDATDGLFGGRTQQYGTSQLDLGEWFELVHWMLGVLRNAARAKRSCASDFLGKLHVSGEALQQPPTGLPFEYLSPSDRANLLSNVWSLILAGPSQLISAAVEEKVSCSLLMPYSYQLPPSLAELATVLKVSQKGSGGHFHPHAPRSPSNVLMRWNRLLRKFQR